MKSPVVLLSALFDDVDRMEPGVLGLNRDLQTIESRFENEGYGFLSVALSALCDAFDQGMATGRFTCPTHFSVVRGGSIPKFLQGLICKVFDAKTGLLLEEPSLHAVKCMREILRLYKKVQLRPAREDKLHKKAVAGFILTDDAISRRMFPSDMVNLLRSVSRVVLPNLDSFESANLPVKHGPGSVVETSRANQKWLALQEVLSFDDFLARKFGFDIIANLGSEGLSQPSVGAFPFEDVLYDSDQANGIVPERHHSGIAKLITVPKNCTSLRTITMEPVVHMYVQQGLNTYIRDCIKECSVLRSCLALTDQGPNQKLALAGSISGDYATIDLSSASDLLGLDLVKLVFETKPQFLTAVLDCRSTHVDVGGNQHIRLRKFAGMGNALTFPLQSITFALLAICGVLCTEGSRPSYVNVKRAAKHVRVFGDDIIVKSEHVHQVVHWLTSFGLKVNQEKSFTIGNFRESCGVDAYKGVDVTPIYLRHEPDVSARNPEQLASLVSTMNQAWFRCLYSLADAIRAQVERVIPLQLVSRRSAALGLHSRVDTTIAQKWDGKLQRLVFQAPVVESIYRSDHLDGYAALWKSLSSLEEESRGTPDVFYSCPAAQAAKTRDKKHLERSVLRFHTRIRKRWVPAEVG